MEDFIVFTSASGKNLLAKPDSTYEFDGKRFINLDDLPKDLREEISNATEDFGGFKKFGKCIDTSYVKFMSNFRMEEFRDVLAAKGDYRFFVVINHETYLISDEV